MTAIRTTSGFIAFVRDNPRFLGFGLALAFFSSFGQTFFVSLFNEDICALFDLTDGEYGTVYSLATLGSAVVLVWSGKLIDRMDLRMFAVIVCAGLVLACLGMALVASVAMLVLVIFLLRHSAQGLMSHTAMTTMARYFDAQRGRALSIAGLGFPLGEAIFPALAVAIAAAVGWRWTWAGLAVIVAVAVIPLVAVLLRGHRERHAAYLAGAAPTVPASATDRPPAAQRHHWTRDEMVRDTRFYLVMPAVMAPGFIMTGFFFHQVHLCDAKAWDLQAYTGAFVVFAAVQIPSSILIGPVIDRIGATRLLPAVQVPLVLAMITVASFDALPTAYAYLALAGLTGGIASPAISAMWAELYGTLHLGAIRSLISALGVLATAGSPALMGWLIDATVTMEAIAIACAIYVVLASALTIPVAIRARRTGREGGEAPAGSARTERDGG